MPLQVERLDGRAPGDRGEESPGSTEARRRVTPGGVPAQAGGFRESATENKPPRMRGKGEKVR